MSTLQHLIEQARTNFTDKASQLGGSSEFHLFDFRVVALISGRQLGSTHDILQIFNPETDVYVGTDRLLINDFGHRLGKPFRYLNLNSKNIRDIFRHIQTGTVERVFFDVGASGLFRRRNVIDFTIKALDETLGEETNPIYVLT